MVFLFSAFCVYQYDIKKKKAYQVLSYRLLLLIAIGVAGCRCVVGGDTVRYMRYFEEYPSLFEVNIFSYALFDPLWLLLNSAIKIIWDDFFFFQFVHAILLNILLFYLIKKYSGYKFTVVFFYFSYLYLYYNMEILREALAIAIFLYALRFYKSGNWGKYYLMVFVCFLFHSSAVVTFFIPLFRYVRYSFFKVFLLMLISIVIFNYLSPVLEVLMMNPMMVQKFELYKDASLNTNAKILHILIYVFIPMLVIYINNTKLKNSNSWGNEFYMTYFFFASLSVGNTAIGNRFMNYIIPVLLLYYVEFLVLALKCCYFKKVKVLFFIIAVCMPLGLKFSSYFKDTSYAVPNTINYFRWFPYTNIWERNDVEQQQIIEERISYVDALMFYSD